MTATVAPQVGRRDHHDGHGRPEEGQAKGKSFKVVVAVTSAGGTPTGTVEIYKGSKLLGTGTLGADGKVTIKITKKMAKKLKKGKNTLTAKYLGSASFLASQATLRGEGQEASSTEPLTDSVS